MIPTKALIKKIGWRATAPSIFLVLNSFVWYILTYTLFKSVITDVGFIYEERLGIFTVYFLGIAISAMLGAKFIPRAQTKFLTLWSFAGAVVTLLLITIPSNNLLANALLAFFLGISIGTGLPSCLSYFADSTLIENRGFVSGIIWSGVGFAVLLFAFLISQLGLWETIVVLAAWRLFGGTGFFALNRTPQTVARESPGYLQLLRKREILLYLFPWVMFSFINFAEAPILEGVFNAIFGPDFYAFVLLAEYVFIGVFAIVGGVIADLVGRKRIVIAGFVMLGIEYAALSVFYDSPLAMYLFLILDGITWGLFFSVFFTTLWGDLGENYQKEKYYALGGIPFLLANFLSILIEPIAIEELPIVAAFSFASFFLFLAVLPLMYAPETLPEKKIKERELKGYLEKAKKEAEKYY